MIVKTVTEIIDHDEPYNLDVNLVKSNQKQFKVWKLHFIAGAAILKI